MTFDSAPTAVVQSDTCELHLYTGGRNKKMPVNSNPILIWWYKLSGYQLYPHTGSKNWSFYLYPYIYCWYNKHMLLNLIHRLVV